MQRYSLITDKNPREIILLRGLGCKWKKCTFCDYHFDCSQDVQENFLINSAVINKVDGRYGKLEVINSGSFCELDEKTLSEIEKKCVEKNINEIHFESHWIYRHRVAALRERFKRLGVTVKVKIGVETFDRDFRETVLKKGINESDPARIAEDFDEVCLLFGLSGQTVKSMKNDIELGLDHFERVCVNIMCENSTGIKPDKSVISAFASEVMPLYINDTRVDILIENTDFGVGG